MTNEWTIKPIAKIITDFPDKFGVPRQSGIVDSLFGIIQFEPQFRHADAIYGLDGFSHLWIIWGFSDSFGKEWTPMVRPPRLGGNTKVGVFSTRSPFRPNPLALSVVKIEKIDFHSSKSPLIYVSGIDMKNGSPIFDIKPYIPYSDCHPDARSGFVEAMLDDKLEVDFPDQYLMLLPENKRKAIVDVLSLDPRPSYQNDPNRIYGIAFAGFDIRFRVKAEKVEVVDIVKIAD